ncbi:MAG: hypothetical protein KKE17_11980 [Proteobacteria bacterium]|nr:hypothetical protein [Pseudomonadota bacterium]MBU1710715.1 hypothetical protein [Pseudomonadota bacterium]
MQDSKQHLEIIRETVPFHVDNLAMPYAEFVPRLYNYCKALGFRKGLIMPSRAFCSDENQGLPIILLTKHFGSFPFNHGRVGGIVATSRHGPHAHHGEDSVIVQASHVGYDPDTGIYGRYRRPKMETKTASVSCGKITHVITPYLDQYKFARDRIFLLRGENGQYLIKVKNSFVDFASHPVKKGFFLRLEDIAKSNGNGKIRPVGSYSTSQTYEVSDSFRERMDAAGYSWKSGHGEKIGDFLTADLFDYHEELHETDDSILLERNLIQFMPQIVTAKSPQLQAALINIQLEFARAVESIRRGQEYAGKNLLYIAGLNIDISEYFVVTQNAYPATTYFVPWAAHIQLKDSDPETYIHPLEQQELFDKLMEQSVDNPDQVNLKEEIAKMMKAPRFDIRSPV